MLIETELMELLERVKLFSTKSYNFSLGRTYFTGNDGYQNFLFLTLMFYTLTLDNNKTSLTGYQLAYHPQKVNHWILILP